MHMCDVCDDSDEVCDEFNGEYDVDNDSDTVDSIEDIGGTLLAHHQIVHDHIHVVCNLILTFLDL